MGGAGEYVTHGGLKLARTGGWHMRAATLMGAGTTTWILWRFSQDGDVFLGLRKPWEHRTWGPTAHHHGDGHGHGHGEGKGGHH